MKKIIAGFSLLICAFSALAAEPTDASIEKLLIVMKAESLMDSVYGSMEQNMRQGMAQVAAGQQMSDEQKRVLENAPKKFAKVVREELTWANLKPLYIQVYKESFDQKDIDGLIAFYSSKVGQSYINKMPLAMQKTMAAVQQRMEPMIQKMGEAMKEAVEEAKLGK
jgi:hypothetical protein